ncbi:MAG: DNA mismatch repair endonuclease MutL [Verrucomicrobiota bacterium]
MAKVHRLPDRVANQIAAGEVIERPAAVIKELVENAVDAGATRVEVEFRHGGRSYMRIEDNGHGMSRDDAQLALERHATSKIAAADDLDRLVSFGFRGEALPSIASVSRFTLQTREQGEDNGTEILINGGRPVHVRDCGRPVGTRIEVAQLFNSVPARRKFLKTDRTESAHIVTCVRLYALAFPEVAFTLIEDGRVVFKSPECPALADRVAEIFGRQLSETLVPIDVAENGLRLHGLIGKPGLGRATRHEMISFINRRPVDSRTLNYALIESFHESLPKGRYPAAFVFLEIDPAAVDVNVHPAKREVRFRSEAAVRGFVIRSVLQRLRELGGGHGAFLEQGGGAAGFEPTTPQKTSTPVEQMKAAVAARPAAAEPVRVLPPLRPAASVGQTIPPSRATSTPSPTPSPTPIPTPRPAPAAGWRFLGLAHSIYALFETSAGIVLLDRRAAQERIWFERLETQFREGGVTSQRLLLPVPLELDPVASALLTDRLVFLHTHGFEVSEFGRHFFRIEGVPAWMESDAAEAFIRELLGALREGLLPERDLDTARGQLARMAATRAVRLGDSVSPAEMQALVAQLFACRAPHVSPGGRPTHVEVGHGELNRRFQK